MGSKNTSNLQEGIHGLNQAAISQFLLQFP